MGVPEYGDERTLGNPGTVPRHYSYQDHDRPQVNRSQHRESQLDGAGNFLRRTGLSGGDGDKFKSSEGVESEAHGQQRRQRSSGKESAMRRVFRFYPAAQQQPRSQHDESGDGRDFDHREPVFKAGIVAHAAKIDQQQQDGKKHHPKQSRDRREPIGEIGGGGDQFRADRDRDGRPVAGASNKSRPLVQIDVAIDPERTGGGMHAGEFAQRQGYGQRDECRQDKTKDDAGSGDFEGRRRSQQQASPDGPAYGDHGHLAGAKLVTKSPLLGFPLASGTYTGNSFSAKEIFLA